MWFKILILINLILILISLFSGALFLAKGREESRKLLGALKTRVALSILLIVMLILGFYTGQIAPHGI